MLFFKNKIVIFLTKTNWDYYLHPYRTLYAKELYKLVKKIYWINQPTRNPLKFIAEYFKNKKVSQSVVVFTPLLLCCTHEKMTKLNACILRFQIFILVGKINNRTILWSVYCSHKNFITHFPSAYKIYWPGDLFDPSSEQISCKEYDLLMPLTEQNYNYIKDRFPDKAILSTTGCDENIFSIKRVQKQDFVPFELQFSDNLKIIGYVGNISDFRLDFELIIKIIDKFTNLRFVFIGISDKSKATESYLSILKRKSNFKLIENLEYNQIPFYINQFYAGIIPYKLNHFNLGTNPNKFYEYSSMGKITISSDIPSLRKYHSSILICKNEQDWINQLSNYLDWKIDTLKLISIATNASPKKSLERLSNFILNQNRSS